MNINNFPLWRLLGGFLSFLLISVPLKVIGNRLEDNRGRSPLKLWLREIGSDIRWLGYTLGVTSFIAIVGEHWGNSAVVVSPLLKLQAVAFCSLCAVAGFSVGQKVAEEAIEANTELDPLDRRNLLTLLPLVGSILKITLYTCTLVAGLGSIGIDVAPFIQAGAVVGIVVGLAIQTTLQDLFATLFLFLDPVLYVGDRVRYLEGDSSFEGVVTKITAIRTFIQGDGELLIVCNRKLDRIIKVGKNSHPP